MEGVDVAGVGGDQPVLPVARRVGDGLHLLVRSEWEEERHRRARVVGHDGRPQAVDSAVELGAVGHRLVPGLGQCPRIGGARGGGAGGGLRRRGGRGHRRGAARMRARGAAGGERRGRHGGGQAESSPVPGPAAQHGRQR